MARTSDNYQPGDIVGVQGGFLSSLSNAIFAPPTRLYHFLVIRSRLELEDDYEIIEMGQFNCDIGRLAWYKHKYFVVFHLTDPEAEALGKKAAKYASKFGRRKYDYGVFVRLPLDLVVCWFNQLVREHRLRRVRPAELRFTRNSRFICTELCQAIWKAVGIDPIDKNDVALPAAFVKAEYQGRLAVVDINYPQRRE